MTSYGDRRSYIRNSELCATSYNFWVSRVIRAVELSGQVLKLRLRDVRTMRTRHAATLPVASSCFQVRPACSRNNATIRVGFSANLHRASSNMCFPGLRSSMSRVAVTARTRVIRGRQLPLLHPARRVRVPQTAELFISTVRQLFGMSEGTPISKRTFSSLSMQVRLMFETVHL